MIPTTHHANQPAAPLCLCCLAPSSFHRAQWWWVAYQFCYMPCESAADDVAGECGRNLNGPVGQCTGERRVAPLVGCGMAGPAASLHLDRRTHTHVTHIHLLIGAPNHTCTQAVICRPSSSTTVPTS